MTRSQPPAVDCYVRSLASRTGQTERVLETLRRLEREGTIETLSVTVWGEEVGLSTTAVDTRRGQSILDTVSELRGWADGREASLDPFFQHRERHSTITGETYTGLRLPAVMLAEREGDSIVRVTPYERAGDVTTVEERLSALAATSEDLTGPEPVEH